MAHVMQTASENTVEHSDPATKGVESTDVALVGAGPIGLEMAHALKTAGIDYVHFESGSIGSTMLWWAPETVFFSSPDRIAICGVPIHSHNQAKTSREQYLAYLRSVADQFDLLVRTHHKVLQIDPKSSESDSFTLHIAKSAFGVGDPRHALKSDVSESSVKAKRIILAIGDMHRPQLLGIEGEELPNVSHYLEDAHAYYGEKVLIVGGKNSAIEAAVRLFRVGAKVSISYRRASFDKRRVKYWLLPEVEGLIQKRKIAFFPNTTPTAVSHSSVTLSSTDQHGRLNARDSFEVLTDNVLLLTGYEQDNTLFKQLNINLLGASKRPELNPATMESNCSQVYVIGTASAGTQLTGASEFIETSHRHVLRVINHLTGIEPPVERQVRCIGEREQ